MPEVLGECLNYMGMAVIARRTLSAAYMRGEGCLERRFRDAMELFPS